MPFAAPFSPDRAPPTRSESQRLPFCHAASTSGFAGCCAARAAAWAAFSAACLCLGVSGTGGGAGAGAGGGVIAGVAAPPEGCSEAAEVSEAAGADIVRFVVSLGAGAGAGVGAGGSGAAGAGAGAGAGCGERVVSAAALSARTNAGATAAADGLPAPAARPSVARAIRRSFGLGIGWCRVCMTRVLLSRYARSSRGKGRPRTLTKAGAGNKNGTRGWGPREPGPAHRRSRRRQACRAGRE